MYALASITTRYPCKYLSSYLLKCLQQTKEPVLVLHCIYLENISFEHAVVVDVFPIFVSIFNQIDQRGGRQEVKAINNNNFIVSKIVGQEMRTIGTTIG